MTHLAVFLLSTLGFTALALAMERQQEDLFGRSLPTAATLRLRAAGWAALALAMAVSVEARGWGVGLVSFSGHASLGAGLVFGALVVAGRAGAGRR